MFLLNNSGYEASESVNDHFSIPFGKKQGGCPQITDVNSRVCFLLADD